LSENLLKIGNWKLKLSECLYKITAEGRIANFQFSIFNSGSPG